MQLPLPLEADQRLFDIHRRLLASYGPQRDLLRHEPTAQFVKAMISSCTLDAVSQAAFQALCVAFPSWARLPDTSPDKVETIIREVTRPMEKAIDLVHAARGIRTERGDFELAFLASWPVEAGMAWLKRFHGVGSKVAAATLNFSTLRKRALVVDRHVLRVAKCQGFLPATADFERGFRILMRMVPPEHDANDLYELHWLMKLHSQRICRHRRFACRECPLAWYHAPSAVSDNATA